MADPPVEVGSLQVIWIDVPELAVASVVTASGASAA
jgi:hypothetical protein